MESTVYLFSLQPEAGLSVELRVRARSVSVARREVQRFLAAHDGSAWAVEGVARERLCAAAHPPVMAPGPRPLARA